ncbi:MAG TPA: outer membrane protein assembly factor BamD [Terriglobales bacterium]|nr:outer membrane protein assembly factor BamD [Terriglobales bacterium]
MFRRAIITVTAAFVFALCSMAQDAGSQSQSGSSNPAPSSGTTQAQSTNKQTSAAQPQPSSSKKKKKSKKNPNPIADLDSKQPDKVLFDRAQDAMKHGKYDVARLSLQTLINTYPDSEYIARAKLAIGDSWYQEGGAAAMTQAESEYKDFITFFPNMPEAAEAQMKIANIHFSEMEKADRDPTHARRAEEEYRQMILQFPDSPLVPEAKAHLLQVQEVLARREYMIGHFYYLRESYPAAIARLQSVVDTYPLYSGADDALFELGQAYEKEIEIVRHSRYPESAKGGLIKQYTQGAIAAYGRILTRYPLESRAGDAKKRLEAMKQPVPKATPEAIAQDKAEIESRGSLGTIGKVMENFHRGPDVSEATKVGEPTLVDPKQASAPDMVRAANASVLSILQGAGMGDHVAVEQVTDGSAPAENAPVPRSDAAPGTSAPAPDAAAASDASGSGGTPAETTAGTEMKNDLPPAAGTGPASAPAPTQVNDLANGSSSSSAPAASSSSAQQQAPPANTNTESSSKKKKKRHLLPF